MGLIVIDGSDGTGKATQVKRLSEEIDNAVIFDFPDYSSFFGRMIGEYLNNKYGEATKVDPYLISMLYAADRWKKKDELDKALDEGKTILLNRYTPSSMAHQGSKTDDIELFVKWVEELEYEEFRIPKPDKVIILSMPASVSQRLIENKEKRDYTEKKRDGHESDVDYIKKTNEAYLKLADIKGWDVIECAPDGEILSKEEITKKIMEKL